MSVIVKGMKIPKNCLECKLKLWEYDEYYCPFSGISALCIGRQTDCPLVEIPPHGRLIDADALTALWKGDIDTLDEYLSMPLQNDTDREKWLNSKKIRQNLIVFLSLLPTVIEAEDGET